MNVLACLKRVPDTGSKMNLTDDAQRIDTSGLGFTMSPHEECAVEEAVQLVEQHGGTATALTLGPPEADEQLRTALAMRADRGVLLETDGSEWGPTATAHAITDAIRAEESDGSPFDLLMFGNESADMANYQVGVRVAHGLDRPCVTGIKSLEVAEGVVTAKRDVSGGSEIYELGLPAVVTVKEGLNEPRYASMRAKMLARRQEVERYTLDPPVGAGFERIRLETPAEEDTEAVILGEGPGAAGAVVELLQEELELL